MNQLRQQAIQKMLKFYNEAFGFKVLGAELDIPKDKGREI
jgi:hypothetical protein